MPDFFELHGDRAFGDDPAIVAGIGLYHGRSVVVIGHQKGRDLNERTYRNFGMARPEGYRKAIRAMSLADRLRYPVLAFIDTPGAYPGVGAEQRGQAGMIARSILAMTRLSVPIVVSVIGEGGSGGALAIGVGDRVLMQEHAIYSVISPEGCAAILWKDAGQARKAAVAFRPTARACLDLGVIDGIVEEPSGGAHRDHEKAARLLDDAHPGGPRGGVADARRLASPRAPREVPRDGRVGRRGAGRRVRRPRRQRRAGRIGSGFRLNAASACAVTHTGVMRRPAWYATDPSAPCSARSRASGVATGRPAESSACTAQAADCESARPPRLRA